MSERAYPLPRPSSGEDSRFTFGLSYDVGQVLESYGYPPVRGADHVELMQTLFRFIYAREALPEPRETAPAPSGPGPAGPLVAEIDERRADEHRSDTNRRGSASLRKAYEQAKRFPYTEPNEAEPAEGKTVDHTDGPPLTLAECRTSLAEWERRAEEAKAAGDQVAYAYRSARAEGLRRIVERAEQEHGPSVDEDQPTSQPTPPARGHVQEKAVAEFVTGQAEAVIEGWTPGAAVAVREAQKALPDLAAAVVEGSTPRPNDPAELPPAQRLWVHSGPCIYCSHGPACVSCDLTQGPHWGIDRSYPGPVCSNCSEECKRREIAADPYYRGDYVEMFGDDE